MELRSYQLELIEKIENAWKQGYRNVLMQLPTGGGKTRIFCRILSKHQGHSIVIAHRVELIAQIALTLAGYKIRHNIITNQTSLREIIRAQLTQHGANYYDARAQVTVIGIDTLIKLDPTLPWLRRISLVVQDEGHHVLQENKWGKGASYFPQAKGLYPTATPRRADGHGLGRCADGVIDIMICGPTVEWLIANGYLSKYQIFAPKTDIDLSQVPTTQTGDFSPAKLRTAVHKSTITGSAIKHYLKLCPGKLAVAFSVDIESAIQVANEFKAEGIAAEVISSKTPMHLRHDLINKFKNKQIFVLVNVDLFGEGVDIPEIEVIIMLRPTQSFSLYVQQFGRALRKSPDKKCAIILDHVGNVLRHGLPDPAIPWSLERRERKSHSSQQIMIRVCLECCAAYERYFIQCPLCGFKNPTAKRSSIAEVEGDLFELDPAIFKQHMKEVDRIDNAPLIPQGLSTPAQLAIIKRHKERQEAQWELRNSIAQWAGYYKTKGFDDSMIYRKFYCDFNVDVLTAKTFNTKDAGTLEQKILAEIKKLS